jgi:hypothetical protein
MQETEFHGQRVALTLETCWHASMSKLYGSGTPKHCRRGFPALNTNESQFENGESVTSFRVKNFGTA